MDITLIIFAGTQQTYRQPRVTGSTPLRSALSGASGNGENTAMSVTLDNGDGKLTMPFSDPPLRLPAIVSIGKDTFAGTVSKVTMGTEVTIDIES